ncbi:MAG: hypothetical protein K6E54_06230, partial [Bacteroidaceae bacterium]|nr:hypothetical protein [Bacteroidaceae bacterium]
MILSPIQTYAWEAHLNENDEVEIYTVDKKRTSGVWYYTVGVSITRCKYNPTTKDVHESGAYFYAKLNNFQEILENGTYYNTWTIALEDIISDASTIDPTWAEEIQNAIDGTGPAIYLKLDCMMMIVDEDKGLLLGPFTNTPEDNSGLNITGLDSNGDDMLSLYGWTSGAISGLKTHFNHYLLIGNGEEPQIVTFDDELVTEDYTMDHYAGIDSNQPAFAMSNYSSEFDLSEGIPSSEYMENSFLADSWYGNTKVYARMASQTYTHNMTYRWQVDNGYWDYVDTDGDGIPDTYTWVFSIDTYSESHMIPVGTAYAAFQYLADTHIYDFTNADISNGAYDGDHVYYDDTLEVPMTCISTSEYKDVASASELYKEEPDWYATTEDHVSMGTYSYPSVYDFGLVSSRPDIESKIIEDRDNIREQISESTKTRNDKLVIEG